MFYNQASFLQDEYEKSPIQHIIETKEYKISNSIQSFTLQEY